MRDLIKSLGGTTALANALNLRVSQVNNWNVRGVPWRYRPAVAQLAHKKNTKLPPGKKIKLPPDFLPQVAA